MSRVVIDSLPGLTRRTGSMSYVTLRFSMMDEVPQTNDQFTVTASTGQQWTGVVVARSEGEVHPNGNQVALVCVRFQAGAEPSPVVRKTLETTTVTVRYRSGGVGPWQSVVTDNISIYAE